MEKPLGHLAGLLAERALRQPDTVAYEFIDEADQVTSLTYVELASRASALAQRIRDVSDDPVLLLYPAGLPYVVGIFGAFLAGVPVIPAYPPGLSDGERLRRIAKHAGIGTVLSAQEVDLPVDVPWLAIGDEIADIRNISRRDTATAIIQYTSGSTGDPRGVMVSHTSLSANTAAIGERFGLVEGSRAFSWLPPFHDMGLVGGILSPLAAGIPVRLMAPTDFLKSPLRWLHQISITGATVSGGPNFAYDLCVRRARTPEALAGLDLSTWDVAFNGAEAIKHRTLKAFADCFGGAGFRSSAFMPCYGLAEATLIVSAGRYRAGDGPVSCGTPVQDQDVRIVDGEIWIAGPHVTEGYWKGDNTDLFGEVDGKQMLRTGDQGHLDDGELFITGRLKDVIVHRGVNYHPEDIEEAALSVAGHTARSMAAVHLEDSESAQIALVMELTSADDLPGLSQKVREAVMTATGLWLDVIVFVPPRSIPRTSSGKVRRHAARDLLLDGVYNEGIMTGQRFGPARNLAALICGVAQEVCGVRQCEPSQNLLQIGTDSLRAGEAAAILQEAVDAPVPLELVLQGLTPERIASLLIQHWMGTGLTMTQIEERIASATAPKAVA